MNDHETELWNWFLFKSFLTPQRAKTLLYEWEQRGLTLQHVLAMSPEEKVKLGLSQEEAGLLHTPSTLPACAAAIRRNEPEYPRGLCKLPPKVQPALLFYAGERALLTRPILYLPPLPMASEEDIERTREVLSLLLGEGWLPATVRGSMQADLLLKEMRESEGEALLFVRSGLKQDDLEEAALLESHRLVLITPLPSEIDEDPKIAPVLSQVESAAASVCIVVGCTEPKLSNTTIPTAWVNTNANYTATSVSTTITLFSEPMELLIWLANQEKPPEVAGEESLASELPVLPPLPPDEALQILEQGGRIPEALRKRLLGEG